MLEWDQTEFIGCLEVIPEEISNDSGGGPFYIFKVCKAGIELELTIFPFEDDVLFRLFREGEDCVLFEYQIMGCKYARHEKNKSGNEYLKFCNQHNLQITLSVNPDIKVSLREADL